MAISLISAPQAVAFVGTPVARMPQSFVLETNRYTAAPQASTAISESSGKVRYAYTSHPYKAGDVITGTLFSNAALNVRQTVTSIAANTFDTDLVWQSAFSGLTGTVTRTNGSLQLAVTVRKGATNLVTRRIPVDSTGRVKVFVDSVLLRAMVLGKPPQDKTAVLDAGSYWNYSIYAVEEFDDAAGLLKTADNYTSGTYYATYGYRGYKEERTAADHLLTIGSYNRLLTGHPFDKPIILPRGETLWLCGLIVGGDGITTVKINSDEVRPAGPEINVSGTHVSTADANCKVVAAYGPDLYSATAISAEVYLFANAAVRISEKVTVVFTSANSRSMRFVWLNSRGGWDSVVISHYKKSEYNVTEREVAWRQTPESYTVGDAAAEVYHVQAMEGFRLSGQVPGGKAGREFARIMESERVFLIDGDNALIPVYLDGEGVTFSVSDDMAYFDIEFTYAIDQI